MSFLFVWQTCLQSALVVASGAIGFAQYFRYLVPMNWWETKAVSGLVVIAITALLYRNIRTIGRSRCSFGRASSRSCFGSSSVGSRINGWPIRRSLQRGVNVHLVFPGAIGQCVGKDDI